MTLSPGQRVGPYEVVGCIGTGGMGDVYRARDTRLDRDVAIKTLRPGVRSSLEREARAIAALNHPHICSLHDIVTDDGADFLVMEYLSGESLASRLARGPLKLDEAIAHAIQICDALAEAHKAGIIHRDLKPGNIMLTRSGIKLLDFGIATRARPAQSEDTVTVELTADHTLSGTIPYMAPEQLQGANADARSDIFAFGAVLYEMLTGKRAFPGENPSAVIAEVIGTEPAPIVDSRPEIPASVLHVVRLSLAKAPEKRWQAAADIAHQLRWVAESRSSPPPAEERPRRFVLPAFAALGIAVLAAAATFLWRQTDESTVAASILPPADTEFASTTEGGPIAVSPDGRHVAMVVSTRTGKRMLALRDMSSPIAKVLAGTEGALSPFWAPDGKRLAFFAAGKLQITDVNGSTHRTIADAESPRGGTWNQSDIILLAPTVGGPIFRISASGGNPAAVTRLNDKLLEANHRWPEFLPDGDHFTYFSAGTQDKGYAIWLSSLSGETPRRLVQTRSSGKYVETSGAALRKRGYLVFGSETGLMAQSLDTSAGKLIGEPATLIDNVAYSSGVFRHDFSVTPAALAYRVGIGTPQTQLLWLSRDGRELGTIGPQAQSTQVSLSPDNKQVAISHDGTWIFDTQGTASKRLAFRDNWSRNTNPVWSPDGRKIAFSLADVLAEKEATGVGPERVIYRTSAIVLPTDWSPDGRYLLFQTFVAATKWDVLAYDMKTRTVAKVAQGVANERHGQVSPNGKWVLYTSDRTGRSEIFVSSFPDGETTIQVTSVGAEQPRWSRDSNELYYLTLDNSLVAATVKAGREFTVATASALFQVDVPELGAPSPTGLLYAPANDGKRFLINVRATNPSGVAAHVLLNWRRLLPE